MKNKKEEIIAIPSYWKVISIKERLTGKTEVIVMNKKTGEVKRFLV